MGSLIFSYDPNKMTELECAYADQLFGANLPTPHFNYRFHPTRRWLIDFAWPSARLAVEIQGGAWLGHQGGHTSGAGYLKDCEKANALVLEGWRLLRFQTNQVKSGEALRITKLALGYEETIAQQENAA